MSDILLLLFDGIIVMPLITVILVQMLKPRGLNSSHWRNDEHRLARTPLEIAQERYVRGEIGLEEFEKTVESILRSLQSNQYW